MNVYLSLIIPIYNAEIFVQETLVRLSLWKKQINYETEIILINDGSTDSTEEIIRQFQKEKDHTIKIISYSKNQGKGFAVKMGMLEAKGKFRIYTDADIPFGFDVINNILNYLDFKDFDICVGNRKMASSAYFVKVNPIRRLSSIIFTTIISRYVVTGINDTQCGLKGFKDAAAVQLFSKLQTKGFAFDVELLYLSYKYNFDIKRIPVLFEGNNYSTISLTKNSIQMFWDVLLIPFRYHLSNKYKSN